MGWQSVSAASCFCGGGSSSSAAQCYKWPFGPSVAATISPETFCQEEVISLQSDTFFMHLKTLLLLTACLACASIAAGVLLAARVAQWFHKLLPPAWLMTGSACTLLAVVNGGQEIPTAPTPTFKKDVYLKSSFSNRTFRRVPKHFLYTAAIQW